MRLLTVDMPLQNLHPALIGLLISVVLIAAAIDIRTHRIPNWLSLPFLLGGMLASGILGGWHGLAHSLLGILLAAAFLGVFCYLGGMGMGDLKLCAALGAWLGPEQLIPVLVLTGIAGGLIALCRAVAGSFLRQLLRGTASLLSGFATRGLRPNDSIVLSNPLTRRIPYAPAIAIGTVLAVIGRH